MPYANSDNAADFAADCAQQVNDKLGAVTYANNSLSYVGSAIPTDFELSPNGQAILAATQIATGVLNYYLGGIAPGIPGAPSNGGISVVSGQIIASAMFPVIQSSLLSYFSTGDNSKDTFENELDKALSNGINTIITTHIEMVVVGTATVPIPFPGIAS